MPTDKEWEYQIIERPNDFLIILYKIDESIRGHIRLTSKEEVDVWKENLTKICSQREL